MSSESIPKPDTIVGSAYLFAHLLRALVHTHRADLGDRWRHLGVELGGTMPQLAAQSTSSIEFFAVLCERLGLQPTSRRSGRPVSGVYHLDVVTAWGFAHGRQFEDDEMFGPEFFSVPWIDVLARVPIEHLQTAIGRCPSFFASLAVQFVGAEDRGSFARDYGLFAWAREAVRSYTAPDLSRAFRPERTHVLMTLLSPLAHGGDASGSNVTSFRREDRVDLLTGAVVSLPFVAGGALRGICRDLMMLDWLSQIGVDSREVVPNLAHSLLSGGSIDAGATLGVTDNAARAQIRDLCPAWDLFGGVIEGHFMEGQLLVGDALPVCRETAAVVAAALGWSIDQAREARETLPTAGSLTVERMATRRHHDEIQSEKTQQMIFHTQAIQAGHQMAFSVALRAGRRATGLQTAALGYMLRLLADHGTIGAKGQSGFGQVALRLPETASVGATRLYTDHVAARAEEARAWLTGARTITAPPAAAAEGEPAKGKAKGRKGKADVAVAS